MADATADPVPAADLSFGAPLASFGKPWGIGLNYEAHAGDLDEQRSAEPLDLESLPVRTEVNGEVRAENEIRNMPFPPAEIVSFHSDVMTSAPGDLFSTGTPGAAPVDPGDGMRAVAESIGTADAPVTR